MERSLHSLIEISLPKKAAKKYFTTAKISIGISKYGRRLWNISDMIRGVSFDKYTSFLSNEF